MLTRADFLQQLWKQIINAPLEEHWIDNRIRESKASRDAPFADVGMVLKRLLSLGASPNELSLLARFAGYEAVFQTLYMLEDPGISEDDLAMLHESLLAADPSGMEGRPGSAPQKHASSRVKE